MTPYDHVTVHQGEQEGGADAVIRTGWYGGVGSNTLSTGPPDCLLARHRVVS